MKKIILMLILSLSFAQAIFQDGAEFTNDNKHYENGVKINLDGYPLLIECIDQVVYFSGTRLIRRLAISYNPITNKPYFCSQKRYLLNKTKVLIIKIRYNY